ncbi:Cytochrome P450 [Actinokineospora alba]|uniref:Cytochrome P450 n=1 Tax=Actinokineospora alba TaxID=504798 RepID=A0A1H0VHV1_9PSEU|nr:cytochrome P450 [Actinokineospora alba]TDP67708.1 cytochrome P450 [Actinokineospora alba]SDJ27803.1 Cytochrome P450 [Actinokineospora alba]SDP78087.1 Cytochrome P450 [Actinokineospora alba]
MITVAESVFAAQFDSPMTLGRRLAALGREVPVVFDQRMGAPLVLRHKDVSAALRDTATFGTQFYGMGPMAASMIAHDGAEHTRQRRIHNRFFSPGVSRRYEERIVPIAVRTFGSLEGERAELVEDAIARYPMQVFLDLLGIPDDVGDQGLAWVRTIVSWLGSPMEEALAAPGMQAYQELSDYTRTLVEAELADPKDNLLGEIIRAHLDEDQFSLEACVVAVVGLILGGFETTIQMMTATISSLLLNPDALDQVRADRSLIEPAIDEAFRWANPSAGLYRLVLKDVEIAGTPIAAGSMAYFCIAAAHYDEEAFPEPEVFDVRRRPAQLGFGLGPHYCVGAPLARIEVRAAVDALLDGCPGLRLDPGQELTFRYGARGFVQHGTDAVPVVWSPRA